MHKMKAGPESIMTLIIRPAIDRRQTRRLMVVLLLLAAFAVPTMPAFAVNLVRADLLYTISSAFKEPSDVAVSTGGNIYVVDGVNHRIKIFSATGQPVAEFGEEGAGNGQFRYPLGIDVDRAGTIYIADSGNSRVQIFRPDSTFSAKIALPPLEGRAADPTDVAVDRSRQRLYVVDNDNHRFLIYDLATLRLIKTVGTRGEGQLMFRYPFMIALGKQHLLNIVDVLNTRVQVVSPDGRFVRYIGGWGVEKGLFFRPKGVAVDRNGKIYVSDSYMGVIQVFDAMGAFHGVIGDAGNNDVKRFRTPTGLFIDDHNRLYVVEMLAQQISVYRIETGNQ